MERFKEIFQDLVVRTLEQTYQFAVEFIPKLVLALLILIIGWLCAVIIKKFVSKLLKALGFDVVSEKTGLKKFLEKGGVSRDPSSIIGLGFYWLIIFSALVMIFNTLNLEVVSQLLEKTVLYMPKVIVALILLSLGIFLSQFVGKFVQTTSHLANIPFHEALGKAASYAIIGLAVMMALEQLDVATTIVVESFIIIFGVVPLVLVVVLLVGGRDILSNMLASRILIKEYKKGDKIEFDSISGHIESVGLTATKIKDSSQEIIIPNLELAKKIVRKG